LFYRSEETDKRVVVRNHGCGIKNELQEVRERVFAYLTLAL